MIDSHDEITMCGEVEQEYVPLSKSIILAYTNTKGELDVELLSHKNIKYYDLISNLSTYNTYRPQGSYLIEVFKRSPELMDLYYCCFNNHDVTEKGIRECFEEEIKNRLITDEDYLTHLEYLIPKDDCVWKWIIGNYCE